LSDRANARHRSPQRAATPLTQLTDAVTDQLGDAGRTGAIVAISTGLVAAVALPAQALGRQATAPATAAAAAPGSAPASAPAPAYSALTGNRLTVGAGALTASNAALSAPAAAVVSFETGNFTAVPKPAVSRPTPAPERSSTVAVTSRTAESRQSTSDDNRSTTATGGTAARGSSVLSIAARYVGTPYVYGGTTPRGFDCSGYTRYVYAQLGVSLPRTANAQMLATKRISRSEAKPGDLVFFVSGGRAYHNGIYAGDGMMYDSPRSGKSVSKRAIWDATIVFGRVTG
jgi:cell wall-associated NlpC family hydrolase